MLINVIICLYFVLIWTFSLCNLCNLCNIWLEKQVYKSCLPWNTYILNQCNGIVIILYLFLVWLLCFPFTIMFNILSELVFCIGLHGIVRTHPAVRSNLKFDICFTEFGTALTTILIILFQYCYKHCYSDSRNLWAVMKEGGLAL